MDFEHKSGFSRTITPEQVDAIFAASRDYVIAYGVRQSLADSYASAKTEKDAEASFDKKLRKLLEGSMDIREVTRSTDPVKTEARRLANKDLDGWIAEGTVQKPKDKAARRILVELLMSDETRMADAQAEVERAAAKRKTAPPANITGLPPGLGAVIGVPETPAVESPPVAPKQAAPKRQGAKAKK